MGDQPEPADGNRLMDYTISPLSEHTGAEIRGIDLTEPIDEITRARLNRAFVDHSVLVFRGQHLTPQQLFEAVGLVGEGFPQHNSCCFALPEYPLVHYISNQDFYPDGRRYIPGKGCHTDHSNAARPPKATVPHAVSLPDRGSIPSTSICALPTTNCREKSNGRLDGLRAIHVYQSRHSARKLMELSSESCSRAPDAAAIRSYAPTRKAAVRRSTSARSVPRASSGYRKRKP
jgi:taurine dioxygenase